MSSDTRLAFGAALAGVVLLVVLYGIALGIERYTAAEAVQTERRKP